MNSVMWPPGPSGVGGAAHSFAYPFFDPQARQGLGDGLPFFIAAEVLEVFMVEEFGGCFPLGGGISGTAPP